MDKRFETKIKTLYQGIQNCRPNNIGNQNLYMNKPSRKNYEIY